MASRDLLPGEVVCTESCPIVVSTTQGIKGIVDGIRNRKLAPKDLRIDAHQRLAFQFRYPALDASFLREDGQETRGKGNEEDFAYYLAAITNMEELKSGHLVLFPQLTFFQHNCEPNCIRTSSRGASSPTTPHSPMSYGLALNNSIVTTKSISAGTVLSIHTVPLDILHDDLPTRQQKLGFACSCQLCLKQSENILLGLLTEH